jgi:hypothetical protein
MQKKRKSPWPFQKVLGSLRHFILLFGAYDSPTLKLVPVPILPLPAVTGYYLSPRHETFIFRPFTGETRRTPSAFATFRIQIPNRQLFRTLTEKLLVTTVTFQISLHTTQQPPMSGEPNEFCWSQQDGSAVGASRQLSLWRQKAVPPHRGRGGRAAQACLCSQMAVQLISSVNRPGCQQRERMRERMTTPTRNPTIPRNQEPGRQPAWCSHAFVMLHSSLQQARGSCASCAAQLRPLSRSELKRNERRAKKSEREERT